MFESAVKIAASETDDLIELAHKSGHDSPEFFIGADLSDTDLRGLDFSAYYFIGVNIKGALIDRRTILPSDANLIDTRYDLTPDMVDALGKEYKTHIHPNAWPESLLYLFACFIALDREDFYVWAERELAKLTKNEPQKVNIFSDNYSTLSEDILPIVGKCYGARFRWPSENAVHDQEIVFSAEGTERIEKFALKVLFKAIGSSSHAKSMVNLDFFNILNKKRPTTMHQDIKNSNIWGKGKRIKRESNEISDLNIDRIREFLSFLEENGKEYWRLNATKKLMIELRILGDRPSIGQFYLPKDYYLDFKMIQEFLSTKLGRSIMTESAFEFCEFQDE